MSTQTNLIEYAVESIELVMRDHLEEVIDDVIDNHGPFDELSCKTQQMLKEGLLREVKLVVEVYED